MPETQAYMNRHKLASNNSEGGIVLRGTQLLCKQLFGVRIPMPPPLPSSPLGRLRTCLCRNGAGQVSGAQD